MRCLEARTIKLRELKGDGSMPYAILSHTWENEEVTFGDIHRPEAKEMAGYAKIKGCCDKALEDGFEHVWIDTCCIDKSSSSELSEAINSMYLWYQNADVCYVYLSDVPCAGDHQSANSAFAKSRWFARGWTLQELLAPRIVVFYDREWNEIGTKWSLQEMISVITGIDKRVLLGDQPSEVSIAKRMSWASKRTTTRGEDIAYCLMGIFGVNMPPLYGEGSEKAFMRLQHEIIKSSTDHTIFAWARQRAGIFKNSTAGLLAKSPLDFVDSGAVTRFDYSGHTTPYSITNNGLLIKLPLIPVRDHKDLFMAILNCQVADKSNPLGVYLKRVTGEIFVRLYPGRVAINGKEILLKNSPRDIYVMEKDLTADDTLRPVLRDSEKFFFKTLPSADEWTSSSLFFRTLPLADEWTFSSSGPLGRKIVGFNTTIYVGQTWFLRFKNSKEKFVVALGLTSHRTVWSDIVTQFGDETNGEIMRSYSNKGKRSHIPSHQLDRNTKPVLDGKSVSVAIRKVPEGYHVEVKFSANDQSHLVQWHTLKLRPKYQFSVRVSSGLKVWDVRPCDVPRLECEFTVLSISRGETFGYITLLLPDKHVLDVILGIHNDYIWTSIDGENVNAKEDTYSNGGVVYAVQAINLLPNLTPITTSTGGKGVIHVGIRDDRFMGDVGVCIGITLKDWEKGGMDSDGTRPPSLSPEPAVISHKLLAELKIFDQKFPDQASIVTYTGASEEK